MELLVATLAHLQKGNYDDAVSRLRFIVDTVKNAQGMMNARLYCGKEGDGYSLILTAWENEETWQKAQERYNPRELLLQSTGDLLSAAPEQWLMHYLWGYSRPAAQPLIAEAHLATVQPDAANRIAQQWLDELRRQALSPTLAFAFLARGTRGKNEDTTLYQAPGVNGSRSAYSYTFLNLLSWPGESHRKEFYADQHYKALQSSLTNVGMVRVLTLEPS
ncbi:MAG TPA: hypothetical protein VGT44_01155 [Ktedonobacteraceae bacterium]|nr:hypothetical protein [Ktedonobacteraceae bacterium]